jgi:predicted RNA-binding protein (virulence factor B family)
VNRIPNPLPHAEIGDVAQLTVISNQSIGTFLDWGKPKDLFLPFSEQTRDLYEGEKVIVYLFVDNNQRSCASMKIEKFMDRTPGDLQERDRVELFIISQTDLGFKAVINGRHVGVLYRDEIFKPLRIGQRLPGFIKKIREDGKIDLSVHQVGYQAVEEISDIVLSRLETRGGFLPVTDKTSAEVIYDLFGVSKKKFKMTIGGLYKRQLITLKDDGIYLNE